MAKKDKKEKPSTPMNPGIKALNRISHKILSYVDSNYENEEELEGKNLKFQQIINRELDIANGVSHGSIVDFIQAQRESTDKKAASANPAQSAAPNLFTDNIDQIYNYLIELYDNKYIEMMDLKYICKFIPVLGKAIKITLDHITASDDIADTIKRKIAFDIDIDKDVEKIINDKIEEIEKQHKLLKRLKNETFKNTLTTGASYIYAVSYTELFEMYAKKKKEKETKTYSSMYGKAHESYTMESVLTPDHPDYEEELSVATESITSLIKEIPSNSFGAVGGRDKMIKETESEIQEIFKSFTINTSPALESALAEMDAYVNLKGYPNLYEGSESVRKSQNAAFAKTPGGNFKTADLYPDGAKDPNELKKSESFEKLGIEGTYVKYIESRDIVPLKIFDELVGYYHIVTKKKKNTRVTAISSGGLFTSSMDMAAAKKEKAVTAIVDSVSSMIMKNFNQKFLVENQEFKKVIADCIIAKGIADNEYSIQFIPAKNIFAFKINENSDGDGESMLADSLLSGKMLLSYLVAKMLLFVNNTGDKTLVTTHKGPIDLYGKNQLDRAVRQLEGTNITFGDFLSPNVMFNKFNRNANIVIPTATNGTKLLEFEKLEGKTLDMAPEMEEKLEKMAIIGTNVPDSLMEYVNDVNFSRQIVSSSISFAGFISSLQSDFEDPMTDLYQFLLSNVNFSESVRAALPHLRVKLPRPKVVSNGNYNENIRTGKELSEMIADLYYGADTQEDDIPSKKNFTLEVCKDMMTFYNWGTADELKKKADTENHLPKPDDGTGGEEV